MADTIGPGAGRRQSHRAVTRIRRSVNGMTLQIPMKKCRGLSMNERKQYVNELYFKMARERRIHLEQIGRLQKQVADLEKRLECYGTEQSTIPPIQITFQVREWMEEYGLPWEVFYCYDHKQWVDELDNSLPYFCDNRCPACRGKDKT